MEENGLKVGEFSQRKWLESDLAALGSIRWCGECLRGLGRDWSVGY